MTYYLYRITNLVNNKIYFGKTDNIKKRWNSHKTAARTQDPKDYTYLHRAMNKHGFDNFIIEKIEEFGNEIDALNAEIFYIDKHQTMNRNIGYNLSKGGDGISGFKFSAEQKKKMSEARKGKRIGNDNPFYGKTHTQEVRELISRMASQRTGNKNPFYGKKHTEASISLQRINHYNKKKIFTEEMIEEIKYKKQVLKITYKNIAKEYGVHWKTISNAINGKRAYTK